MTTLHGCQVHELNFCMADGVHLLDACSRASRLQADPTGQFPRWSMVIWFWLLTPDELMSYQQRREDAAREVESAAQHSTAQIRLTEFSRDVYEPSDVGDIEPLPSHQPTPSLSQHTGDAQPSALPCRTLSCSWTASPQPARHGSGHRRECKSAAPCLCAPLVDDVEHGAAQQPRIHVCRCVEIGSGSGFVAASLAIQLLQRGICAQCFAIDINEAATRATAATLAAHQASVRAADARTPSVVRTRCFHTEQRGNKG